MVTFSILEHTTNYVFLKWLLFCQSACLAPFVFVFSINTQIQIAKTNVPKLISYVFFLSYNNNNNDMPAQPCERKPIYAYVILQLLRCDRDSRGGTYK